MKCEIITINSLNYGNRLQNYALQESLKKLGAEVTTNCVANFSFITKVKEMIHRLRMKTKIDYFVEFDSRIKWRYTKFNEDIESNEIDYFIAGSDQIWNPLFRFNSEREFLKFTVSKKKIAYAASIGVNNLTNEQAERFLKNLPDFKCISVRENEASKLLQDLFGIKSTVVLDPTMLLSKLEWENLLKKSRLKLDKPFIVKYFLGIRNESIEKKIKSFAEKKCYEIIDITLMEEKYKIGPIEFLYLLRNSKFNFVDSFHGMVFSILFEKEFYAFKRPVEKGYGDMNSRFTTIVDLFLLNDRFISNENDINFNSKVNYSFVRKILEINRKKSMNFLKKALED